MLVNGRVAVPLLLLLLLVHERLLLLLLGREARSEAASVLLEGAIVDRTLRRLALLEIVRRRVVRLHAVHIHLDALRDDLVELVAHIILILPHLKHALHLLRATVHSRLHLLRALLQRLDQLLVEVLPLDQVGESALADLLVEDALLALEVVTTCAARHKLLRLLDDALELPQAVRLLDLRHALPLHRLDLLADAGEEILDQEGSALLDQVRVHAVDLVLANLVLVEGLVKLIAQLFRHQCSELHSHEPLLEDARVADLLLRALDVASHLLAVPRAELIWISGLAQCRVISPLLCLLLGLELLLLAEHL